MSILFFFVFLIFRSNSEHINSVQLFDNWKFCKGIRCQNAIVPGTILFNLLTCEFFGSNITAEVDFIASVRINPINNSYNEEYLR